MSRWMARSFFYPTLYWTMLKASVSQTNPWLNEIDNQIILGALPRNRAQKLSEMGVGLVINTCEEWDGNATEYKKLGMEQMIIETIDYTAPRLTDIEKAVENMRSFLKVKNKQLFLIHIFYLFIYFFAAQS
jgi:hypothetical protein